MHARTHTYIDTYTHYIPLVGAECPRADPQAAAATMGASTQPSGNPAEEQDLNNKKTHQLPSHTFHPSP